MIVDGWKGWICLYRYASCVVVCMVGSGLKTGKKTQRIKSKLSYTFDLPLRTTVRQLEWKKALAIGTFTQVRTLI